jgi:Sulfotransferase family
MQGDDKTNYKYVFVCGLHRSGTSVLGRNIARLENCTGFKNTGADMDEGQLLQDVYTIDTEYGGAGRFGFEPSTHRTETSHLLTQENVSRLRTSWHSYWDSSKTICVEKTPGNLLMTRFLQAAFANSYFVVIRRHPVPVSIASQRWKINITSLHSLFKHWLHCHEMFEGDKRYLRHLYELTYEDYIKDPVRYHEEIAAFIGTRVPEPPKEDKVRYVTQWRNPVGLPVPERAMEETTGAHNKKYFDRWCNLLATSFFRNYYRYIAKKYEPRFVKYGYSLTEGFGTAEKVLLERAKISAVVGILYCLAADAFAFFWRSGLWIKRYIKQRVKALLPGFILTRIRQTRQRASLSKREAKAASS